MLQEKHTVRDLHYQVRNASGKNIWIRSYGIMRRNEDKSEPLFYSGRVAH